MTKLVLPPKNDVDGLEARVLLAECRTPAFSSYTLNDAKECMRLMDRVLWNRVAHPRLFGLKSDSSLLDVVKAPGQFAGFSSYPNYDASIVQRIQDMLEIANSTKDKRSGSYRSHVEAAISISDKLSITEPSPGILASWRTAGASSPGSKFTLHATVLGNDFYYIASP